MPNVDFLVHNIWRTYYNLDKIRPAKLSNYDIKDDSQLGLQILKKKLPGRPSRFRTGTRVPIRKLA